MSKGNINVSVENIFPLIKKFLYSDHEIFLRELISNGTDATSKLKHLISIGEAKTELGDAKIEIILDKKANTLSIKDQGLGMTVDEVEKYINQIAFSGAEEFLDKYKDNEAGIIGHFGLGFYSAFMVADKVEVLTKKAGESKAFSWSSDGKTGFSIKEADRDQQGTTITLFINNEGEEFVNRWTIESLVKKYSDHIAFPIFLHYVEKKDEKEENVVSQINSASAFWKRSKGSLKKKELMIQKSVSFIKYHYNVGALASDLKNKDLSVKHVQLNGKGHNYAN